MPDEHPARLKPMAGRAAASAVRGLEEDGFGFGFV
jgi:hypothetical protein